MVSVWIRFTFTLVFCLRFLMSQAQSTRTQCTVKFKTALKKKYVPPTYANTAVEIVWDELSEATLLACYECEKTDVIVEDAKCILKKFCRVMLQLFMCNLLWHSTERVERGSEILWSCLIFVCSDQHCDSWMLQDKDNTAPAVIGIRSTMIES